MFRKYLTVVAAAAIIVAGAFLSIPSWAATPQIWFSPLDPSYRPALGYGGSVDYQSLFETKANWQTAATNVGVFKFTEKYMRRASDDDLRQAIAFLGQHHIAFAIEFGLMPYAAPCPPLEGFDSDQLRIARRIQNLGGKIDYVAADSPFLQAHEGSRAPACNQPIDVVAEKAAHVAREFRSVFPNVKFVDIEAVMNFKEQNTAQLISQWHAAFAKEFGEPFAALNFDINWNVYWQSRVRSVYQQMRKDHMPVGVICDGSLMDHSDADWLRSAEAHCGYFVQAVGGQPDAVIIQSWFAFPTHVLPERNPNSFTHMILDYVGHQPN